ncbi:MAG: PDZ domain-containing protein, partial [bacterium]|nr:PDZ domain-containing protein [bacterium]
MPVQVDPVQEPWRWAAFPELKGQGLRCMAEAADSSVWFGTDGGTMRYDGATWSSFSPEDGLLGAPVYTLCSMDNGDLYAGSEWGLSCFRNGRWQRVFPVGSQVLWPINDLQKGVDGSLWAATAWGALHFSQGDTVLYTTREMGQVVASLVPGLRLVYIPEGIVPTPDWWYPHWNVDGIGVRVIEGSWASLRSRNAPRMIWALAPGGPGEQAGLQIGDRILSVDGTPPAWTNDAFKGPRESEVLLTVERPGQQGVLDVRIRRRKVDGQYTECAVYSVHEDREGRVWFGMPHGEIVCFAPGEQEPWRVYGREQGLKIAYGPRVLQTQDRTVWAVGKNSEHQIYRLEGHVWETALAGRGDMVGTAILEAHNGALWVGGRGLRVLQHDEWHEISLPTMIPRHYMRLMQTSDGAIWIAGQGEEAVRLDYGTTRWTSYRGLLFECALEDGSLWFLSHHREVVRKQGASWLRYGVPDGLMGRPHTLIESRNGGVLALGYHQGQTALSRFDGTAWQTRTYAEIEMGDGAPQVFEDRDEHVWFSGKIGIWEARGFSDTTWKYHSLPEAPDFAKAVGQTSNGNIWVGGWYGLRRFDGNTWSVVSAPEGLQAYVDVLYEGLDGNLWVGTRLHGLFRFTGESWVSYSYRQGLADNHILGILQTIDGTVWAVTRQGVSRFDGRAWLTHALPPFFIGKIRERGLRSEKDGTLWINLGLGSDAGTVRYRPESRPPQTVITSSVDRVSQPGNTVISWQGSDPWRDTADDELQYAWRLDGGEWSEFTGEKSKVLFSLESGAHAFEVHARDRDFNVDPTPALVRFTVIAPVWRQGWFITLVIMFIGLIALQTKRVMRRDRRLLLQTSRLVSLGQMTAAVAHELNQPLAAISAT